MRRLLLVLVAFVAALLVVATILFRQAHRAVVAQEGSELGYFANQLLQRVEDELGALAFEVRDRPESDYRPPSGPPQRRRADAPYVLAWMACRPDGKVLNPAGESGRLGRYAVAFRRAETTVRGESKNGTVPVRSGTYQSSLSKRYLEEPDLREIVKKSGLDGIIARDLDAACRAGLAAGNGRAQAQTGRADGPSPVRAVFLDDTTVFICRAAPVEGAPGNQGVLVSVPRLLRELVARQFTGQPMERFTKLTVSAFRENRAVRTTVAGDSAVTSRALDLSRAFSPPFDFVQARLLADAAPPSPGRATLRILILVFAAVALIGGAALVRAVQAQAELARRRTNFVSSVTHELKTPLTAIGMYVEMLELGMAGDAETRQRYFDVLKSETARLSRLIHNVLEFSRLEARKRRVTAVLGDLAAVLREAERIMARQAEREGFQLRVEAPEALEAVFDREAVVQILVNLVENSLKFGASAERREVVLFAEAVGGGMRFGVRDTGPGISERFLGRAFDDFTRGDDPVTRQTKGTGIGLALVRRLAQAMGGRAEARNNHGEGCTVSVVLPG